MSDSSDRTDYISDAEKHNAWWNGESADLDRVLNLQYRSDFYPVVKTLDRWAHGDSESGHDSPAVLSYAGPNGIGKTRLLQQVIGYLVDLEVDQQWPPSGEVKIAIETEAPEIVGDIHPTQILYVPVEESLYDLEEPGQGIAELQNTIDYFQTHIARPGEPKFVFIDDLGALSAERDVRGGVLDAIDDETYLVATDTLQSPVDFQTYLNETDEYDDIDAYSPLSILPIKFVDYVQWNSEELHDRVGSARPASVLSGDEPPIGTVRDRLQESAPPSEILDALDSLYAHFSEDERYDLHELSKSYLRNGGFLYRADLKRVVDHDAASMVPIDETLTQLINKGLQLTLLKEVGPRNDFTQPRNLVRLASLAAQETPPKFEHKRIANLLDVDRRTINRYLDALEEAAILTQSREFSIARHRRARLYLRDPRYVIALSRRVDNEGFVPFDWRDERHRQRHNQSFERRLALSVGFDHACRLSAKVRAPDYEGTPAPVEKVEHDAGGDHSVDYIIHNSERVYPFVLEYQPKTGHGLETISQFDPATGSHDYPDNVPEPTYESPVRFIITDHPVSDADDGLKRTETDHSTVVRIPFWQFLLFC